MALKPPTSLFKGCQNTPDNLFGQLVDTANSSNFIPIS